MERVILVTCIKCIDSIRICLNVIIPINIMPIIKKKKIKKYFLFEL